MFCAAIRNCDAVRDKPGKTNKKNTPALLFLLCDDQ